MREKFFDKSWAIVGPKTRRKIGVVKPIKTSITKACFVQKSFFFFAIEKGAFCHPPDKKGWGRKEEVEHQSVWRKARMRLWTKQQAVIAKKLSCDRFCQSGAEDYLTADRWLRVHSQTQRLSQPGAVFCKVSVVLEHVEDELRIMKTDSQLSRDAVEMQVTTEWDDSNSCPPSFLDSAYRARTKTSHTHYKWMWNSKSKIISYKKPLPKIERSCFVPSKTDTVMVWNYLSMFVEIVFSRKTAGWGFGSEEVGIGCGALGSGRQLSAGDCNHLRPMWLI